MNIYVGNISYNVREGELSAAFKSFGQVESVKIIRDKYSGQSKGFGFIEMPFAKEARSAITHLNGKELNGMTLKVNEARLRSEKDRGRRSDKGQKGHSHF